jgi:hypothetical protein
MDINNNDREILLHKILFGGDQLQSAPIIPISQIINQKGEKKNLINIGMWGGADNSTILSDSIYFQKINTLFVILFFCIIIAFPLVKMFLKIIFPEDESDSNFEEGDADQKIRWNKIIRLTFLFILLIIILHFIVFLLIFSLFYMKAILSDDPNIEPFKVAIEKLKLMIWEYEDDHQKIVGLIPYYMLLFFVLIIMFLFYIIYTKLVKSYFSNIFYEDVYNPNNPEIEDKPLAIKYLYQYAVFIILMMLFGLLLLNYTKLADKKVLFVYNILYIAIYLLITINILRLQLNGQMSKFILFIILFIFLSVTYKYPLKWIAKYL